VNPLAGVAVLLKAGSVGARLVVEQDDVRPLADFL